MGPFSDEITQGFLQQGRISPDDLAWMPGLAEWTPLAQVLLFSAPPRSAASSKSAGEPATAKQKAFLTYLKIPFSPGATKEEAAVLVTEAMETPKLNARVLQWNDDRLKLHPELFAAEAQEKKEARVDYFFEACHGEGADCLSGVTHAHCQVLVTYLDVNFPGWDAHPHEAARQYFFPAVAEKFPQFVRKPFAGKLHYPGSAKGAVDLHSGPVSATPPRRSSRFSVLVRALALGLVLLLVIYVGMQMLSNGPTVNAPPAEASASQPEAVKPAPARELAEEKPAEPAAEPAPPEPAMAASEPPPSEPPAPEPVPAPPPAGPKTVLAMTKPTTVAIPFGTAKLLVGQQLKIISVEGNKVKARFGADIVTIPIEATDLVTP